MRKRQEVIIFVQYLQYLIFGLFSVLHNQLCPLRTGRDFYNVDTVL